MTTTMRLSGVAVAAAVMLAAAITVPAAAQDDCESYAQLAVKQGKANEEKQCGMSGQFWTTNLKQHLDWCSTVPPDEWRKMLAERQAELDKCGG